jgi:hypothetical protein
MKRRLLNLATLLSLLLCVAAVVLWVRSRFVADTWCSARTAVGSVDGGIVVLRGYGSGLETDPAERGYLSRPPDDVRFALAMTSMAARRHNWNTWGFGYSHDATPTGGTRLLFVPYWAPALAAGVLAVYGSIRAYRRRQRLRAGHCPRCGYDLRASPGRCPECGRAAAQESGVGAA